MTRVIVLPAAVEDIDHQASHDLNQGSPDSAIRWIEQTKNTIHFIASNQNLEAGCQFASRSVRPSHLGGVPAGSYCQNIRQPYQGIH